MLIPALNESAHLQRTVQSVRDTVPGDVQIIVVDDGSDDGCADFLRRASAAPAVLLQPGARLGAIGARNLAASAASGKRLVFLDAHMLLPEGWLAPLIEALEHPAVGAASPAVSAIGNESLRGYGMRWTGPDLACDWLPEPGNSAAAFGDTCAVPLLPGACLAMRREVFFAAEGFDRGLVRWGGEDAELSMRLWCLGYELRMLPRVVVAHLFRERHPYPVEWLWTLHNQLRIAFVHFGAHRLARVIAAAKPQARFAEAWAMVQNSDATRARAFMQRHAQRGDDAYFERFGDICH